MRQTQVRNVIGLVFTAKAIRSLRLDQALPPPLYARYPARSSRSLGAHYPPFADEVDGAPNGIKRAKMVVV